MATISLQEAELPMTVDDFSALEQRVLRAVELVKTERAARAEAEQTAELFRKEADEKGAELQQVREQMRGFEREREQVRHRVEKLLKQIDEIAS
jgi:methyl-accepting chemotaxis protein